MAWVKKHCYVVYGFYKECEEYSTPVGTEEAIFLLESEAEKCKIEWENSDEFKWVDIEEDERELWVDDLEARRYELKKMDIGVLLATLDDEVQKLAQQNNEEWARTVSQSYYLDIKNELGRRLRNG